MTRGILSVLGIATLTVGMVGCGRDETASISAAPGPDTTYLASTEPADAIPVGKARESAKDQDEIVLLGRIGGSMKPFVDGMAAFTIVDPKVPSCAAEESCPTPWDYCCTQDQVKDNIATVKIVNGQGKPVPEDARQLLGVKELSMVVVHGTAQRDTEGNLAVLADQVFVKE